MIGPKKLSKIRQELKRVIAGPAGDPIARLDEMLQRAGGNAGHDEVMASLRRFLKPRRKKSRSKKT